MTFKNCKEIFNQCYIEGCACCDDNCTHAKEKIEAREKILDMLNTAVAIEEAKEIIKFGGSE